MVSNQGGGFNGGSWEGQRQGASAAVVDDEATSRVPWWQSAGREAKKQKTQQMKEERNRRQGAKNWLEYYDTPNISKFDIILYLFLFHLYFCECV